MVAIFIDLPASPFYYINFFQTHMSPCIIPTLTEHINESKKCGLI